ncbi:MAG: hypothetical protein AB1757_23650 [Acidobacteriota bacterium]
MIRRFLGIDLEEAYLQLSKRRKIATRSPSLHAEFLRRIEGFGKQDLSSLLSEESFAP